jgi:signal transduction histidine kinase/DNA-binding response OmpR family regulator
VNLEVSCRTIQAILQFLIERHQDTGVVYAGLPYSPSYLANKNERISWDDFRSVVSTLRTVWTDKDFEELGSRVLRSRSFYGSMTAARLFFNTTDLYVWLNRNSSGPGAQFFSCIRSRTAVVNRSNIVLTLWLTPGHQPCHEFYVITKGAMKSASVLIGLPPSEVAMTEIKGGATFHIRCPEGGGSIAWLRRMLERPKNFRIAAMELREANEALNERYAELEAARDRLSLQATQLRVAHEISQLIQSSLDLDSTLQAIAQSLVEVAGFAAAVVSMDVDLDDRHITRRAVAGRPDRRGATMTRALEGRGKRIGEVTLTLTASANPAHAGELLEYVVPTIAMEIDEALSYSVLNDLRATLENKVVSRTRELEHTNEALRRAQAGRDRLFANISHELRTPLTLILGPLETMREKTRTGPQQQRLTLMKRSADRLLALIDQMLALARLQSGDLTIIPVPSDLIPFLRGITMSYRSLAATRRISLTFPPAPNTIRVALDHDKAEMLFNNLLINAFKFTPDGGHIAIDVVRAGETVAIRIADTGVGIPAADIPHIFDRYYQGHTTVEHPTSGTGIGLSLAREIAELHRGTITVESVVGTGTRFTVTLPIHVSAAANEPPAASDGSAAIDESTEEYATTMAARPSQHRNRQHQILVIDDDPDVRQYLRDILSAEFTIAEGADGDEGIARAKQVVPDLIICDVMMPGRDGSEVCRALKEDIRTSHIPFIMLTARAGTESRIEGLETGADDFLVKPFIARELLARVRNLIAGRATLHQKFLAERRITPDVLRLPSREQSFLERVIRCVDAHLAEDHFTIEQFSREVGLSRAQMHRKLVALTGCSARDLLRRIRLERSYDLLLANSGTVSEIAYRVGFADPSHFSRCFRKQYGFSPAFTRRRSGE